MASLADIPGLGGFIQQRQLAQQEQLGQLQQLGVLSQLAARMQEQEMKQGVLRREEAQRAYLASPEVQAKIQAGDLGGVFTGAPNVSLEGLLKLGELQRKEAGRYMPAGEGILNTATGETQLNPFTREQRPQNPSGLSRLLAERDALPAGDPRRAIFDNAIRKESETAKQISPTIVMPKQIPVIGVDANGNQTVNWASPENGPQTFPTRPPSLTTSGNQQALALRREYNLNPEVKLADSLEPRIAPIAEYVASVGKSTGNAVSDAELVKVWLMTTHPKGDQISNLDMRSISQMPDLWGRVKNVAGNFVLGKTLDADTRADMWKSISAKYKATAGMRDRKRQDIVGRGRNMGIDESLLFPAQQE